MQPELTKGNIQMPKIKANKRNNQTCHLMIKGLIENINNIKRYQKKNLDLSTYLHIDHIIRWKDQYPHWRMSESIAKKKKMPPGNDIPGFCQAGKG